MFQENQIETAQTLLAGFYPSDKNQESPIEKDLLFDLVKPLKELFFYSGITRQQQRKIFIVMFIIP